MSSIKKPALASAQKVEQNKLGDDNLKNANGKFYTYREWTSYVRPVEMVFSSHIKQCHISILQGLHKTHYKHFFRLKDNSSNLKIYKQNRNCNFILAVAKFSCKGYNHSKSRISYRLTTMWSPSICQNLNSKLNPHLQL